MYKLTDTGIKIKECPFCGSPASVNIGEYAWHSTAVLVRCDKCGASTMPSIIGLALGFGGEKDTEISLTTAVNRAIGQWNNRKAPCGSGIPTKEAYTKNQLNNSLKI